VALVNLYFCLFSTLFSKFGLARGKFHVKYNTLSFIYIYIVIVFFFFFLIVKHVLNPFLNLKVIERDKGYKTPLYLSQK
jgi:hypothetical protein